MTQESASTFEAVSPFPSKNLGDDRLQWLTRRARPFHCTVGQELLRPDRMPEYCFCIVEGRGRVLHDDPGLRRPVTLAYSQPGDWLVGLFWHDVIHVRDHCSNSLKLIGFPAEDFYTLESESEAFRWRTSNSPAELMAVLEPALRARVVANPPEREVLRQLLWPEGRASFRSSKTPRMMPFGLAADSG